MIRRSDPGGPPLTRWQFPELRGPADHDPAPPAAESAADEAVPDDGPALADLVAAETARGRTEGFEHGLAEGRDKGYAEGLAAGARAAEEALAGQARRLAAIVEGLSAPLPALDRAVEEAVVALALEIARVVIGGEIARSRESLIRLLREAIAKVPIETGALEVVLNPADLDLVRARARDLAEAGAVLRADAAVEEGGCLVVGHTEAKDLRWHSREGLSQIDLSLAARWRHAMLALFDGEAE